MADYTILTPVELPEHCYLLEALYWRAFGRAPIESYHNNIPFRDSSDNYEGDEVNNLDGEELSEVECEYANLSPDPRMKGLLDDRATSPVEHYETVLREFETRDPQYVEAVEAYRTYLDDSRAYHADVEQWMPSFEAYIDEFKAEICLDLKRGKLTAKGRLLPHPSPEQSYEILEGEGKWYDALPISPIPNSAWITTDINWVAGAIHGNSASYIWILLPVAELLVAYPPTDLIKPESAFRAGTSIFVSGLSQKQVSQTTLRGRPAYPWDAFHVEVARLYANGEMPQKKEAAIALMQEWFEREMGKSVSRSAVGMKLKLYFDKLGKKSKAEFLTK